MLFGRRRVLGAMITGMALLACRIAQPPPVEAATGRPRIGLNLTTNAYYSAEVAFTNVFKHSQAFIPQKEGAAWGQSDPGAVVFGPDGYPTSIASGHSVLSIWDPPKGYPRVPMVLAWDGEGTMSVIWTVKVSSTEPNRILFEVERPASEKTSICIKILSTNPANPVRNVRLMPAIQQAAFAKGEPANPFREEFIKRWSQFGSFRYMDWGATNNSELTAWGDRPKISDQTQGKRGVAVEYQITHANLTQTHPWFCVPHLASDDYVRQLATLIRDTLKPNLIARIEYSNEVWNGLFEQAKYAQAKAKNSPGLKADYGGQLHWYSERAVEIFKIFEEVFTKQGSTPEGSKRLVRVMASHAANTWVSEQVLEHEDAYKHVDALAIAPYFGGMLDGDEAQQWRTMAWDARIAKAQAAVKQSFEHMDNHIKLLRETTKGGTRPYAHIKLFAYEGGQHFLGHPGTHKDEAFTQSFIELNRRPEMQDFYFSYLKHWHEIGGADFMLFSSVSESTQHGSWGLMEHEGQSPVPPKMMGVIKYLEWAKQQPDQSLR
jgi:hypothetical protein